MKIKFFLVCIFVFLIFLVYFVSSAESIIINEVMYNPNQCSDAYCEWVELYNPTNEEINLSSWKISDMKSDLSVEYNRTISFNNTEIEAKGYFIIVKNYENFSYYWNASSDAETNFVLNNEQEIIRIYSSNGSLADEFYYNTSYGANGNNNSLQKINSSGINNISNWCDNPPTPGAPNNCSQEQEKSLELNYQSEVECNENFTITVNAENFDPGTYDVKIDIEDVVTDNRIGKVWNGTKWISTTYYVNNILTVNENGTGQCNLIFKVEDFSGEAYLKPTIRDIGTFEQDYSLSVTCDSNQSNQEESEIKIIDAPTKAQFGEKIEVEINVYKGDTSKYAVYVYVEDQDGKDVSDKITLHFKTKYSNQTVEVELQLKCKNETGDYDIVVEGLGTEDIEEIKLSSCDADAGENTSNDAITIGDFSYSLTIPNTINLNEEFTVKLKIASEAEQEQNFRVWSYVYRGNKCYSCSDNETRESNAKSITIQPGSSAEVELQNSVKEADSGSYKLKIKALQEGLKTPKEFTYNVTIKEQKASSQSSQETGTDQSDNQSSIQSAPGITGSVIESKSFSINKTLPYILATICALLVIYIIIKKI